MISNGKHKAALDRAKDLHKAQHTAASEALLVQAYIARVESLIRQTLVPEARAMLEFVRERYPSARPRLDELIASIAARSGTIDELLQPLNDPALAPERRDAIERAIEEQVLDLSAIAACEALPPDHPLRRSASAVHQAFIDVTTGPVAEEALALPEVSRRSPLAPWKLLVRAVAAFYRGEDEACRRHLDAIRSESAPARLVPAIRAMLGDRRDAPASGPTADLISATTGNAEALRRSLEELDRRFDSVDDRLIVKAIHAAVQECRKNAPDLVERLKQHISVRCAMADLDIDKVIAAMGPARHDAYFFRLYARGMETCGDPQCLLTAVNAWNDFRMSAVQDGWFAMNGVEAATLYLHMAAIVGKVPAPIVNELERSLRPRGKKRDRDYFFLRPEKLYERACVLDPHTQAFSQWMEWTKTATPWQTWQAQRVANAWHKILPSDIEPLLYLMRTAERNGAFAAALQYLAKAERIDALHSEVRNVRFCLMAGNAMRQIQQRKLHLAGGTLDAMAALLQAQQGDRPALIAALRYVASAISGDDEQAAERRDEVQRHMQSGIGTSMLIAAVASACRRSTMEKLGTPKRIDPAERSALPAEVTRLSLIAKDVKIRPVLPPAWMAETARQFSYDGHSFDAGQLCALGHTALSTGHTHLAYGVSTAGLRLDGATAPAFLLLRAQALPERQFVRRAVCAATAAELARRQRDLTLVDEALNFLHYRLSTDGPPITLEQTAEVLEKEKAEPAFPSREDMGPDYLSFAPPPPADPFTDFAEDDEDEDDPLDDEDLDEIFDQVEIPKDMPPEIAEMLLEGLKEAIRRGESPEMFMARVMAGRGPETKSKKKGKRK